MTHKLGIRSKNLKIKVAQVCWGFTCHWAGLCWTGAWQAFKRESYTSLSSFASTAGWFVQVFKMVHMAESIGVRWFFRMLTLASRCVGRCQVLNKAHEMGDEWIKGKNFITNSSFRSLRLENFQCWVKLFFPLFFSDVYALKSSWIWHCWRPHELFHVSHVNNNCEHPSEEVMKIIRSFSKYMWPCQVLHSEMRLWTRLGPFKISTGNRLRPSSWV